MAGARETHWHDGPISRVVEDSSTDSSERVRARLEVWNSSTLAWERMTQPSSSGGGGAATIADGADVTQGAIADAAWSGSGSGTVVAILKKIVSVLGGTLAVSGSLGRSWTLSSGTDSVAATDGGGSLTVDAPVGTPLWVRLSDGSAAFIGQKAMAEAIPVVIASDQSSLPTTEARLPTALVGGRLDVNIGAAGASVAVTDNSGSLTIDSADLGTTTDAEATANGSLIAIAKRLRTLLNGGLPAALAASGALKVDQQSALPAGSNTIGKVDQGAAGAARWLVDASGVAVPITDNAGSLTVDAPVGTPLWVRLSDGAAAFIGQKAMAASIPVVIASDQASIPVAATLAAETTKVIGAVNQGTSPWVVSGGANVFHIDDNAGSVTVDAPVGTPVFVRLSDGSAALVGQKAAAAGIPVTLASDQTVVDNAGFTDGTTPLVMGGYIFDEVAGTALTENDAAAARVDSKRAVVSTIEDGTTRGTRATVKAASTAPAATDTALVVVPRLTPSEGTAFASASKAAGTYTFDIADTTGFSGIAIITDLTVLGASSTVTNSIQVKDPVTAKFATATAAAFTAITTVSTTRQAMHPANAGATGNLQGGVLTKAIRVNVVVATAASTISVGYSLTP